MPGYLVAFFKSRHNEPMTVEETSETIKSIRPFLKNMAG